MLFAIASLLPLAPSLSCIGAGASAVSLSRQSTFLDLPVEMREDIFKPGGLIEYVQALSAFGNAPLATPHFELWLLRDAAKEEKGLGWEDDTLRSRKLRILSSLRTLVRRRSGLSLVLGPEANDNVCKDRAALFESKVEEYASFSDSPAWVKTCLVALFGGDETLARLLPFLSKEFLDRNLERMLQAAALVGDFGALHVIADHAELSPEELIAILDYDIIPSGSVKFLERVMDLVPGLVDKLRAVLEKTITMNRLSAFDLLYHASKRQLKPKTLQYRIARAFGTAAAYGRLGIFQQLHSDHPEWLDVRESLVLAAANDRINVLKFLLMHRDPLLATQAKTHLAEAFEAAVGGGKIETLEFLLGTDEHETLLAPELCITRLHPATLENVIRAGRWDKIEYLLALKSRGDPRFAEFELVDENNVALVQACAAGNLQLVQHLLQKNAQGQFMFPWVDPAAGGNRPLLYACYGGNLSIVLELLRRDEGGKYVHEGIDPAANNNAPLVYACEKGRLSIVRELLKRDTDATYFYKGLNPAARNNKPLNDACIYGHLSVVRELLQQDDAGHYIHEGIDPVDRDHAPLINACRSGHVSIVRELLQRRADKSHVHRGINPAARSNKPLIGACEQGHWLVVQELLQKDSHGKYIHRGVDPAAKNNKPLIIACAHGHLAVLRELLRRDSDGRYVHMGIDPAARDNKPLISACHNGQLAVVRELLQQNKDGEYLHPGVNPAARNNRSLSTACSNGHLLVVQALLKKTSNGDYLYKEIGPAVRSGQCLINACRHARLDVVRFLLQKRPNALGTMEYEHVGGNTADLERRALLVAMEWRRTSIIKFLLQKTLQGDYLFPGVATTAQNLPATFCKSAAKPPNPF